MGELSIDFGEGKRGCSIGGSLGMAGQAKEGKAKETVHCSAEVHIQNNSTTNTRPGNAEERKGKGEERIIG